MALRDESQLELRAYLRVLARRRFAVALSMLVVIAPALISSLLQTPVYAAKAEVLLKPRGTESLFDPQTGQRSDPERAVQTEVKVLKSQPVRQAVMKQLNLRSAPDIDVDPFGQTDVIEVTARSTDAERAATVANAYANAYIDFRRTQAVDDVLAAEREIQTKVTGLQRELDALDAKAVDRRNTLLQQQALFKQKVDQLQVETALKTGGAQLNTAAAVPTSPIKPTPVRTAILALVVGAFFGVGVAFLFEYLDDSITSKEGLERAAADLPTLGIIPAIANWRDRQNPVVVSLSDSKSPVAEAYRTLRTSIQFMGIDQPLQIIQVTSPAAGEGKTTTLANLGVTLAQAGQRVVMVSCDLRRPRLHQFFGLTNEVGFTSVLLGDIPLSRAVQRVDVEISLSLLASGPLPPNPSELLVGRRAAEVFAALRADSDVVLVDSPPLLPVTDAALLSAHVDATVLIATAGVTTRREVQRAHELLRQVDAPVVGTVLNGVTGEGAYGYTYGYRYAYTAAPEDSKSNGRRRPRVAAKR